MYIGGGHFPWEEYLFANKSKLWIWCSKFYPNDPQMNSKMIYLRNGSSSFETIVPLSLSFIKVQPLPKIWWRPDDWILPLNLACLHQPTCLWFCPRYHLNIGQGMPALYGKVGGVLLYQCGFTIAVPVAGATGPTLGTENAWDGELRTFGRLTLCTVRPSELDWCLRNLLSRSVVLFVGCLCGRVHMCCN